ncbi:hypothetical protein LPUS_05349 [Lasallia pustulata]|uniref:DUF7730 domain-containing protein n=1 Tax=Lasallia pustulata TaxID=136370 RepID=A0A1W5CZ81_9LECA|nr:hypothetical protein LPUS_05349 [Lasallia pustulata]
MSSPLLKLPDELRIKVFAICLCDYEEVEPRLSVPDPTTPAQPMTALVLRHHKKPDNTRTQEIVHPGRFLALLYVNKQIHKEALEIFYSRNMFGFSDPRMLDIFRCSLAKCRCDWIKHIRVPAGYNVVGDRTVWDTMQMMSGLKKVVVVVPRRLWDAWLVGKPALESLYRALAEGVELVVRLVSYSSDYGDERVVQEFHCRKGLEGWSMMIEDEL